MLSKGKIVQELCTTKTVTKISTHLYISISID